MAVTKEVFANVASCVATSTYGTTSPASGTTEVWTMGTGNGSFPAAQTGNVPNTYFYASDPADTTHEVILVTDNSTTNTWHVTRGALGTTPVAHAALATYVQVASHGTFQNLKQAPSASTTTVGPVASSTTETLVALYQPTTDELIAGATWEAVAFGPLTTTTSAPTLTWTLRWGWVSSGSPGTSLLTLVTGTNGAALLTSMAAGSSYDVNGSVTMIDSTHVVANLNFWANKTTTVLNGVASSQSSAVVSGSGPLALTVKWGTSSPSNSLSALAPLIYRAA